MAKFKYEGEEPANVYQGHKVKKGDVIELNEHFSEKARKNPSCGLVEVKEAVKVTALSHEEIAAEEAAKQAAAEAKAQKKGDR